MHIKSVIEEGGKSRTAEIGRLNTPANLEGRRLWQNKAVNVAMKNGR